MATLYLLLVEADPSKDSETANVGERKPEKTKPKKSETKNTSEHKVASESNTISQTELIEKPESENVAGNRKRYNPPSIHIDVQIHISPESSAEQIDQIFASMSKHE
jgi:hypothetical protein